MSPTEDDHGADDEETPDDLRTRDPEAPGAGAVEGAEADADAADVPEPNEPA